VVEKGVMVTVCGPEVVVSPHCDQAVFPGIEDIFTLAEMPQRFALRGRNLTEWQSRLHQELLAACGGALITVKGRGCIIKPNLCATAGELMLLAEDVATLVRQLLVADGWHVVSRSSVTPVLH
jgi:hypothetical protein